MTVVYLNPATTTANTGAVTGGGGDADLVMRDGSDSTYITFDEGESAQFTLDDLTLPSGAIIIYAQGSFRVALTSGVPLMQATIGDLTDPLNPSGATTSITWSSPISIGLSSVGLPTDAQVDAASIGFGCSVSSPGTSILRVYEASLKVLYWIKPVVTVATPTGTLTEDNSPPVVWSTVWDPDYTPVIGKYHVKVFSAAQYGAGGFDPDTSTATLDSGEQSLATAASQTHDFTTTLANATYRSYVKVSAFPDDPDNQWSAWDYEQFVVNVTPPGDPTISLSAQNSYGRVQVTINDGAGVTTHGFQLERSDDGGTTYEPVRTDEDDDGTITGTDEVVYDFEASQGIVNTYRVRAFHDYSSGTRSFSAWVTATVTPLQTDWWLKHPTNPHLNHAVTLRSFTTQSRAARSNVQQPLGGDAVVVSDTRGPETGSITFRISSDTVRDYIKALADSTSPLLLQAEYGDHEPDRWVVLGDEEIVRLVDYSQIDERDATYGWTTVARPAGALEIGS